MKERTKYIAGQIRQVVNQLDKRAEVILYGSRARGDERKDSDWDILILTDYPVDVAVEQTFRDKLYDLELEMGEAFSLFIYSKANWTSVQNMTPFYENVNQEGIAL